MINKEKDSTNLIEQIVGFFIRNRIIVILVLLLFVFYGILVAPFDFDIPGIPRDPLPVDAIPDISENQQIVFTQWMGRSHEEQPAPL